MNNMNMGMNNMNNMNIGMNNMNMMGMNNMNMGMRMNNMNMGMGINNNMNKMNMSMKNLNMSLNNMNMMGMNNMNMSMGNENMGNMNNILDDEDRDGWELTFKYDDGKDKKEVVVKISCEKTVQEAINRYKLEVTNVEDMKFEHPPNKELNRALKISQSGLSKKSDILVKPKKDDDYMTEKEEEEWANAYRGRRKAFYMKSKFGGDKEMRKNNNIN